MNKGFLELIDLSLNIQRGLQAIHGVRAGVAAVMMVGLTILACGLAPLVWYFDLSATLDYADPLMKQLLTTLPGEVSASVSSELVALPAFLILVVTLLPTATELLLPRIGARVKAAAFLVFGFSLVDAFTDWPRVVRTMQVYYPRFEPWGIAGDLGWLALHPVLLLFATFLFELLFCLCVVLILALLLRIAALDHLVTTSAAGDEESSQGKRQKTRRPKGALL